MTGRTPTPKRTVGAVAVAALLILAGCSGGSTPTCDVPTTVEDPPGDGVTTPTDDGGDWRLRISSAYTGNLTVILRRAGDDATTFARRYPNGEADEVRLADEVPDDGTYRATMWTDCEDAWNGTIRPGESYHLVVEVDGEVVVVDGPGNASTGG